MAALLTSIPTSRLIPTAPVMQYQPSYSYAPAQGGFTSIIGSGFRSVYDKYNLDKLYLLQAFIEGWWTSNKSTSATSTLPMRCAYGACRHSNTTYTTK